MVHLSWVWVGWKHLQNYQMILQNNLVFSSQQFSKVKSSVLRSKISWINPRPTKCTCIHQPARHSKELFVTFSGGGKITWIGLLSSSLGKVFLETSSMSRVSQSSKIIWWQRKISCRQRNTTLTIQQTSGWEWEQSMVWNILQSTFRLSYSTEIPTLRIMERITVR